MNFQQKYPDFASIEEHVRRARAERAVYLAAAIVDAVQAAGRGCRQVVDSIGRRMADGADRRAVESAYLKRVRD